MTEEQTISWIFLSLALASQISPTDFNGISSIADGINHAVPTHKELQTSISWLTKHGFIGMQEKKYTLTTSGKQEYKNASSDISNLFSVWKKIEEKVKSIN